MLTPIIRLDFTVHGDFDMNKRLQRGFEAVGHEFGIRLTLSVENSQDKGFVVRSVQYVSIVSESRCCGFFKNLGV